jgi:hypothetical protein
LPPVKLRSGSCPGLFSFCCGKSSVAFRSAKVAASLRNFRGAKGDSAVNLPLPQQKLFKKYPAGVSAFMFLGNEEDS